MDALKGDLGAAIVAIMWAIYAIADKIRQDRAERKRQGTTDGSTQALMTSWETAIKSANELADKERNRAFDLAESTSRLSGDLGRAQAELEFERNLRKTYENTAIQFRETAASLEHEVRNKDKTIAELVALNRNLMQLASCANPAIEGD